MNIIEEMFLNNNRIGRYENDLKLIYQAITKYSTLKFCNMRSNSLQENNFKELYSKDEKIYKIFKF